MTCELSSHDITSSQATLLEFLCIIVDQYCPALHDSIKRSVVNVFYDVVCHRFSNCS